MEICMYCEYYNSVTHTCEVTGQKKSYDESCSHHEHIPYDNSAYDWEH